MKILMLADALDVGGAETHVEALCYELKGRENSVAVVSCGGRIAQKMQKNGISHAYLPQKIGEKFCLFDAFLKFAKISRIIGKNRPDIVHAHTRKCAFLARPVCKELKIPLVVTAHAKFSMDFPKNLLSEWGDRTICVSEDVAKHLLKYSAFKKMRISVIKNGILLKNKNGSLAEGLAEMQNERKRVIFASRLDHDCSLGAEILCEIAPKLYKKHPEIQILIIGGGSEFSKIKRKAEKINQKINRELIKTVGYVENPSEFYKCGDLFVGVSRAALEAMARGCAVILLGNEGYLGLLDKSTLPRAKRTNFTCREERIH
jgi:glycosyltransferase involved in cell wall biosynthesis